VSSIRLPGAATRLATGQHGIVSGSQLVGAGLSRRQIRLRVEAGVLERVIGDTYRVVGAPCSPSSRYMAATLAVESSLLAGAAAANLLRVPTFDPCRPEVVTRRVASHHPKGIVVHRPLDLLDRHRTRVDGIAVTTLPRTVLDLAARLTAMELGDLVDGLAEAGRLPVPRMFDEFDLVARRGRPGTARMRTVLEPRLDGLVVKRSELERRGLAFLEAYGFPCPLVEYAPPWACASVARVDVAYLDHRLVIEFDGRRWHTRRDRFENDHLRHQLATSQGWAVFPVTWQQLRHDHARMAARLRDTFAGRTGVAT
jgi:hypothetical protein